MRLMKYQDVEIIRKDSEEILGCANCDFQSVNQQWMNSNGSVAGHQILINKIV